MSESAGSYLKEKIYQAITWIRREYNLSKVQFSLRVAVLVFIVGLLIVERTFWTPDTLFAIFLAVFVVFGQVRAFVMRFLPLVSLLLIYDFFRGFANELNRTVNFWPMINFDRAVFGGHLPTVVLQEWWWKGSVQWYDFYFYFLYTIHFLMPIMLAVLLWKKADHYYWKFVWAIVGLSFAAFITYLIFPAAPPWMAKELGYIAEPLHRVSSDIWAAMGIQNFSEVYSKMPANPVAAIPSLHSAYPLLFCLFVVLAFGKKYIWTFIYPISMWIGVVYMGEHYVIDAILGAMYAVIAVIISCKAIDWYRREDRRHLRRHIRTHLSKMTLRKQD